MKVTKVVRKTYEVEPFPGAWDIPMNEFRKQRREVKMSIQNFEKCFCCGHSFKDNEIPIIAHVHSIGNRFICEKCSLSEDEIIEEVIDK